MRWSTVLYSCMFCLYFISLSHLFSFSNISQSGILKLLKYILIAYAIVLFIQQICVLLGIPIINLSNYDIRQPWKLNSLMSEPEHSGRMVALLMYSYLSIKSANNGKENFIESWTVMDGIFLVHADKYECGRLFIPLNCLDKIYDYKKCISYYNSYSKHFYYSESLLRTYSIKKIHEIRFCDINFRYS